MAHNLHQVAHVEVLLEHVEASLHDSLFFSTLAVTEDQSFTAADIAYDKVFKDRFVRGIDTLASYYEVNNVNNILSFQFSSFDLLGGINVPCSHLTLFLMFIQRRYFVDLGELSAFSSTLRLL